MVKADNIRVKKVYKKQAGKKARKEENLQMREFTKT